MPLKIENLGFRTDAEIASHSGIVETKEGYTIICTPNNPTFHWGNFLLFPNPPPEGGAAEWTDRFDHEFGKDREHVAIGWDCDDPGDIREFLEQGYAPLSDMTLTLSRLKPRACSKLPIQIRTFDRDSDWAAAVELQSTSTDENASSPAYRVFTERSFHNYRNMQERGHGHWWGAFVGGRLVCDAGLYFDTSRVLARFQRVETHPDYRRMGICSHLLSHIVSSTLERETPEQFVICTDISNPARTVYEGIGFERHSHFYGVSKMRVQAHE